jgi:hypothetical protein
LTLDLARALARLSEPAAVRLLLDAHLRRLEDGLTDARGFLLEALDAGDRGQLVLELDGPVRPLAVRVPDDVDRFSILMPVRR